MIAKQLPSRPSLENLKKQAKTLLRKCRAGETDAQKRVLAIIRKFAGKELPSVVTLQDAQCVLAREYGFFSWPKLKRQVDELNRPDQLKLTHRLIDSIRKGDRRSVIKYLDAGANPKHIYDGGEAYSTFSPLLQVAIQFRQPAIMPELLKRGAPAHAWNWNALEQARETGQTEVVGWLESREHKAHGLIQAIDAADLDAVRGLLENDPTLASAYEAGHTMDWPPVILAARWGHTDIVRLLLEKGADPLSEYQTTTFSALTVARYHRHRDIMVMLEAAGAVSLDISDFLYAGWQGDLPAVMRHLNDGLDINEKDEHQQHILNWAFLSDNRELIDYLFEMGADINRSLGWDGYLWFDRYVKSEDVEKLCLVLDAGFDLTITYHGKTLIDMAREAQKERVLGMLSNYQPSAR